MRLDGRTIAGEAWGDGAGRVPGPWLGAVGAQLARVRGPLDRGRAPGGRLRRPQPRRLRPRRRGAAPHTIPELADALAAVVAANGPAHAIIAHSLGATAAAYALARGLRAGRLVFVAPMADPLPYTGSSPAASASASGSAPAWSPGSSAGSGPRCRPLPCRPRPGRVATPPLLLVHDRHDTETGWSDSAAIARSWPGPGSTPPAALATGGILRDPGVVAEVAGFVLEPSAARPWRAAGTRS